TLASQNCQRKVIAGKRVASFSGRPTGVFECERRHSAHGTPCAKGSTRAYMKGARIAVNKCQHKRLRDESTIKMTNNNANKAVVAICKSHTEAEAAVKELQRASFDMKKLSIVGR